MKDDEKLKGICSMIDCATHRLGLECSAFPNKCKYITYAKQVFKDAGYVKIQSAGTDFVQQIKAILEKHWVDEPDRNLQIENVLKEIITFFEGNAQQMAEIRYTLSAFFEKPEITKVQPVPASLEQVIKEILLEGKDSYGDSGVLVTDADRDTVIKKILSLLQSAGKPRGETEGELVDYCVGCPYKECREKYKCSRFQLVQAQLLADKARMEQYIILAERCLELAEHGDYTNGIDAWGIDEGREGAGRLLRESRKELELISTTLRHEGELAKNPYPLKAQGWVKLPSEDELERMVEDSIEDRFQLDSTINSQINYAKLLCLLKESK